MNSIFEAIVAMPLWALAHLRIDGNGLPGPFATNGYFLILEIFLRPILIVFGLLASIQIFSAMVSTLNDIFDLVAANVSGFDFKSELAGSCGPSQINYARNALDRFFYTVLYVILCYMLAMGCFKLIDMIPNTILRWAGVSVNPMMEQSGAAGRVLPQAYQGATIMTQKLQGGTLAALLAK